jgi:Tol biopolymer transport system component
VRANQFLPFLSGISAFNPTFSRDGNWVAYTTYPDHTLWRSRPDGSERLQLTYPPLHVRYSFISPDGKQVVYGNIKGEIYVISMDGGPPQRVVEKDASAANWSPDGNLLVFNTRDAAHPELQFLDLRTGKRSIVPESQDLVGGQWVSEDTLVAAPRNGEKLEIFDVRTQKWSDLVPGKLPGSVVNWAHSPDYKYVYYTTGRAEPKVMRVRLADHKVETITTLKDLRRAMGPDSNTQISVAPDGSAIFTRDIGTQEIYALTLKWP